MEMQSHLDKMLKTVPRLALEQILTEKFSAVGVKVSRRAITNAAKKILAGETGDIHLPSKGPDKHVSLTDEDVERLVKIVEDFTNNRIETMIASSSEEIAKVMYDALYNALPKEVRAQQKDMAGFKKRLHGRYGIGLNKLQMMLSIAREWAQGVHVRKLVSRNGKQSALDDVIFRLHVRACQVVTEIITLLENGLADGAIARWRTLHELTTVASFIHTHGEEAAKKYRDFQIIESKRAGDMYDKNCGALGFKPRSKRERDRTDAAFKRIVDKHGPLFANKYGWAADYFKGGGVNFDKIEDAVGMPEMRSPYKLASYNVHATPKGAFYRIGAIEGSGAILAGHSNAGLTEPAQHCAVSFAKICNLLPTKSAPWILDDLVTAKIIDRLMWEIPKDFWAAEVALKRDDLSFRKNTNKKRKDRKRGD